MRTIEMEVKILPTHIFGTCHVIQMKAVEGWDESNFASLDVAYNESLDPIDIPTSFQIYFTAKDDWNSLAEENQRTGVIRTLKIDTFPHELPLVVTANLNEDEHLYHKKTSDCVKACNRSYNIFCLSLALSLAHSLPQSLARSLAQSLECF